VPVAWWITVSAMITAVHNLVYSDDPAATRAFFADVLGWPHIDAGGGWLIFGTGPSELGVHPTSGEENGGWSTPKAHQISLLCDDIDTTVAETVRSVTRGSGAPSPCGYRARWTCWSTSRSIRSRTADV
jgi:predicted enzyme related to lactoylglutathione lyase